MERRGPTTDMQACAYAHRKWSARTCGAQITAEHTVVWLLDRMLTLPEREHTMSIPDSWLEPPEGDDKLGVSGLASLVADPHITNKH